MKRRLLSILLTACLLMGLLPTAALAVNNVSYLDAKGKSQTQNNVAAVTSSDTGWGASGQTKWYVVNSNVTISGVTVSGNVHLILADGCTLTVNGSIKVEGSDTLTIYGQSGGSGTLNVNNTDGHAAGIGGGYTTSTISTSLGQTQTVYTGTSSGAITINGGVVTATCSGSGAAIGGGGGGTSTQGGAGTVTINGGTVTATSTGWGAAIGGGGSPAQGGAATVTINGGMVTAEATASGTSQATKGYAAAIGSGTNASANVTIKGGIVSAFAKGLGADIGTGATFTGTPPMWNHGNESASITGGIVFRGDGGKVYGDTKLAGDLTIESPKTLEIPSGTALTIPAGKTLTLKSSITNSGSIYVDGTLTGTNYVTGNIYYPLTLVDCTATGTTTHNGARYCKPNTSVTLSASPAAGQTIDGWKTTPSTTVVNMFNNSFAMPYSALTVEAVYTQAVSITTQPSNQTISYGNDVNLTVVAENADGKTNGIAYQWYRVEDVTWVKLTDMTDPTLTLTKPNMGTYQYFCRVSCDGTYIDSNTVTVTVTQASNTVTITGDPGKTYDGQLAVLTADLYTATGDGAVTVAYKVRTAADSTYSPTAPTNAGDYTVRVTQAATTNCAESSATKDFTISPKPVTVSGITAQDKIYDGKSDAVLDCSKAEISGLCSGDSLSVTASGTFSDPDADKNKTVNISNLTLDGASAGNYILATTGQQATTTASITRKSITPTIVVTGTYIYTGSPITPDFTVKDDETPLTEGDYNAVVSNNTAAGTGTITVTETDTGNYSFTQAQQTFTIARAALSAAVTLDDWTYGENAKTPVVTGNAENGAVTYRYKVKNASDYLSEKPTEAGSYTVEATIAPTDNYQETVVSDDFTIAPKALTVTGLTATDRAYASEDTSVELSGGTLDGIVGNDDVTATMPTTGTIESADAGENKPVTFATITLTGSEAGNYMLTQPTVTVNISKVDPNVGEVSYVGGTIYTTTPLNSITLSQTGSALGELRLKDNQTLTAGTADYGWTFIPTDTTNYKTVTGAISLTVEGDTLSSISTSGTPTKTSYKYGENFQTDGLTVTATYASSATRDITNQVTFGALAVGQTEITLSYQGKTCTVRGLTVDKADARMLAAISVSQKYTMTTGEKAIGTAGMPSDADILSYATGTATTTGSVSVTDWSVDATGKVTYTLSGAAAGDTVTLPVVIASTNYENSTVNVKITLTDKETPTATANDITVTYTGSAVPASAITGTASVAGTWSFKDEAPVKVADSSDSVTVVFTPDDEVNYAAVEDTIKVTINKAAPTGTPTYTAITTSGKTLADAALDMGTITPDGGSIAWDVAADTTVTANTAYNWTYTPASADQANFNNLTGSITPYVVSSSGGGGGGGGGVSTYAITVGSTKNGTVTVDPKTAVKGETVTMTVKPDKGYTLETLTVTDGSGKEVQLTEKNGKYTFTMPASKITVKVTFMEDNTMLNFFVDVPANAYYYDAVLWAVENGVTDGVDETHFAPNAPCTRAQVVTFLWRAAGCPEPKSTVNPFTDVKAGSFYETAVLWAVENGITYGTSDTTFSPDATCTRAQTVTFLHRAAGTPDVDTANVFADVNADAYYADAVDWAVKQEITNGTGDGKFSPDADCTRGQIVTFLYRCLGDE